MFSKFRMRITTTAAGIACMVVAVVSAGFTVYAGFRLVVIRMRNLLNIGCALTRSLSV
jgi:hypothetical protein